MINETARKLASGYYDTMVNNYKKFLKGEIDKNSSYNRFLNAAKALAEMGLENPFTLLKQVDDPVVRPTGEKKQVATAVVKKD